MTGRERLERACGLPVLLKCQTTDTPGSRHVWSGADLVVTMQLLSGRSYTYTITVLRDGRVFQQTTGTVGGGYGGGGLKGCEAAMRNLVSMPSFTRGFPPFRII
jgi:hypothetical protein